MVISKQGDTKSLAGRGPEICTDSEAVSNYCWIVDKCCLLFRISKDCVFNYVNMYIVVVVVCFLGSQKIVFSIIYILPFRGWKLCASTLAA